MSRETVYRFPAPGKKPGWPCPRCLGQGNMGDGSTCWSSASDGSRELRIVEPTKCHLCEGSGRVECTPVKR